MEKIIFFFDQQKIFKLYRSVQFEDFILFTEVVDISTTYTKRA